MRTVALRLILTLLSSLLVVVAVAMPALADEPPVVINNNIPAPANVAQPTPTYDAGPLPAVLAPACADAPLFGLDLMFGQMSGLRVDAAVGRIGAGSLRAEGFYGALLTKFGAAEAAGVGARWQTRRCSADGCHAVVFGPGCDVLFHLGDGHLVMVAPTVELAWCRTIGNTAGWMLGINAGIGIAVNGRDTDGDNAAGRVTPLISGFTGFRY
jgi:hypothetical protein